MENFSTEAKIVQAIDYALRYQRPEIGDYPVLIIEKAAAASDAAGEVVYQRADGSFYYFEEVSGNQVAKNFDTVRALAKLVQGGEFLFRPYVKVVEKLTLALVTNSNTDKITVFGPLEQLHGSKEERRYTLKAEDVEPSFETAARLRDNGNYGVFYEELSVVESPSGRLQVLRERLGSFQDKFASFFAINSEAPAAV